MKGDKVDQADTTTSLEEVLRRRYEQVGANIVADQIKAERYARQTKLRTSDQKQVHKRMQERLEWEWMKRDEIRLIAHRAHLEL